MRAVAELRSRFHGSLHERGGLECQLHDTAPHRLEAPRSRERKEAFVDSVADFVILCERRGIRFARATDYPDYYPERPGGKIGRAIEVEPFDTHRIGTWWETARAQDGVVFPLKTDDVWLLSRAWSTPGGFVRGARFVGRAVAGAAQRKKLVGAGAALVCALLEVALKQATPVWLSSPVEELVVDEGRVVGAAVRRGERELRVRTRKGVVLAGGGFAHREDWREKYHGVPGYSSAITGDQGSAIEVGQRAGGAVDLMDDAWWGASIPAPGTDKSPAFLVGERSMPFSIIVDSQGERFVNESASYIDVGHRMLERAQADRGPFWMISDARHTRRYLRSFAVEPGATKALREGGLLHKADTLDALAVAIGLPPERLRATVARFNGFARTGVDQDFARGSSAYDRYYGDPLVRPNPNLGPLAKAPFTAVQLVPGDLGTKGGLLTDEDGRVIREDGSPIEGLYASGNNTASVMGNTYPGPGSTLGPAAVFGLRAARHMAAQRH
ncbi:FAD-binding protein [Egibacter rhizosphaerae]|uniref:FAD-binding protein n=1 Tax=Egibacter rhizosphaerae TaxID=1670831 RepID=UPI00197AD69F|nr:FAD-binding protein [Egibacter rhizosphaerae]